MRLIPPRGERALPVLAGVLMALAYPPLRLVLPSFVGLAPLLVFIAERPAGPEGRWPAIRGGIVAGLVHFGLQLYWLAVALIYYSALAIPAYLGTVIILAAMTGAFAAGVHYLRDRLDLPLAVSAALLWTSLEWVQAHLGDLAFPWLGLGTSLAYYPTLAAAADLVGARGLTLWLAACSGLVATLVLRYREGRGLRRVAASLAVVLALPVGYGVWRTTTLETRETARVAVVQPNISEDIKMDRALAVDTTLAVVTRLTLALAERPEPPAAPVDLVVWPEVTLPADLLRSRQLTGMIRLLSERANAPIVAGAYGADPGARPPTYYNSAFLIDAEGPVGSRYDKQHLVPFVERVPFIDPLWFEAVAGDLRYFGALGRGRDAPVFTTPGGSTFGILICYESIFGDLARRYRAAGADFLVNITNDAWYGREPWYARTAALWQHPAHLSLRAIEARMGIARAANTGISLFVDPLGRAYQRTELFEEAVRTAAVLTTDETTLFVRWGDWLASLAVGLTVLALLVAQFRPSPGPGRRGIGTGL